MDSLPFGLGLLPVLACRKERIEERKKNEQFKMAKNNPRNPARKR
jgi:hypothetical protein